MKVSAVLLLILLSGCSAQYTRFLVDQSLADAGLANDTQVHRKADWVLAADIRLAVVRLHLEDYPEQPRSVHTINEALLAAFKKHFYFIDASDSLESSMSDQNNDIAVAIKLRDKQNNLSSKMELFEGRILHEDQKIGRDYVLLELSLFDTHSGKILDTLHISTRSAFFSEQDETTDELVREGLNLAAQLLAAAPRS